MLPGGKEDFGALAMFEDSVKKLKSLKTSPGSTISKTQVDSSLDHLADWGTRILWLSVAFELGASKVQGSSHPGWFATGFS